MNGTSALYEKRQLASAAFSLCGDTGGRQLSANQDAFSPHIGSASVSILDFLTFRNKFRLFKPRRPPSILSCDRNLNEDTWDGS